MENLRVVQFVYVDHVPVFYYIKKRVSIDHRHEQFLFDTW